MKSPAFCVAIDAIESRERGAFPDMQRPAAGFHQDGTRVHGWRSRGTWGLGCGADRTLGQAEEQKPMPYDYSELL